MEKRIRIEPEGGERMITPMREAYQVIGGAVDSVNGKTGDVVLTTSDLENTSDYQNGTEVSNAINDAISQIQIPTKTSDLENDGADGTSEYVEVDELAAVATSGSYNDLSDKPTIPPIPADFVGTDGQTPGTAGLVPAPATTDVDKFLKSDGTWDVASSGGSGITELTAADYNFPTNNPTGVAIWTLPTGLYKTKAGVVLAIDSGYNTTNQASLVVVHHESQYPSAIVYNWGAVQGDKAGGLVLGYTNESGDMITSVGCRILTNDSLVQATGTGTVQVMSQNATTSMVFADPGSKTKVQIGGGNAAVSATAVNGIAVGYNARTTAQYGISVGSDAAVAAIHGVAIGYGTRASQNSVALGRNAEATRVGEVNIGTGAYSNGYSSTKYRVLGGVHDGQDAHDVVTVSQVNSVIEAINTALSTNIPHIGA